MSSTARGADCPAISLADAIRRLQKLPDDFVLRPADKSLLASAMGFNRMHGAYYTVVAALMQYRLLEAVGDQLQASEAARRILRSSGENSEDRMQAIRDAADAPLLFHELNKSLKGGALPDNGVLKEFFTAKGLSQSKIGDAVRAYRDTVRYVNEQAKASDGTFSAGVSRQAQNLRHAGTGDLGGSGSPPSPSLDEKRGRELKFIDSGGDEVQITFNGPVTSERLQDLIEFAQFQRKVYLKREGA